MMTGLKIRHCNRLLDHIGVKNVLELLFIEFTRGGLISEGILTLDPLPKKGVKYGEQKL